jgi:hypothetical protein
VRCGLLALLNGRTFVCGGNAARHKYRIVFACLQRIDFVRGGEYARKEFLNFFAKIGSERTIEKEVYDMI